MKIKGVIESIRFVNKENGYTVLNLNCKAEQSSIVCVGIMPIMSQGESVEFEGELIVHPKFGEQFTVNQVVISAPESKEGIVRYLSSGIIKGIGEVTAKLLVAKFGLDTLKIMQNDPLKLALVKGISETKAFNFSNALVQNLQMQTYVMFLQSFNISTNTAIKIYNIYKERTKQIVKDNPYKLIDDVDGIGFITADKIARNMGMEANSKFRIRAAVVYTLKECAEKQGNTAVEWENLFSLVTKLLDINDEDYVQKYNGVLDLMILEVDIKINFIESSKCVSLNKYYVAERSIAGNLIRISKEAFSLNVSVDELIKEFERINNIKFHTNQLQAVKLATEGGVSVITGGPGTGKTTIIKCIAYIFNSQGLKIEFAAPTGRASKRLSEATGREAKTIHRLLGLEFGGGKLKFLYNAENPLNCDVIILDELSMVDVNLMNSLLKAVRKGCRIVMVGDKDQLPSVGAGNVLGDIISSKMIDVCFLTYVYRQSEDSLIVSNAHLINNCKMPIVDNANKDFFVVSCADAEEISLQVTQLITKRLPEFTSVNSRDIQVLAPMKAGPAGVDNINRLLQSQLNPPAYGKGEVTFNNITFRCGDKVMQTVNDYEMEWIKYNNDNTVEDGSGVFNGDIGRLTQVSASEALIEVSFDDNRVSQYSYEQLPNLMLAYAITIHKSQGSEFEVAVIPLTSGPPTICNKNLLYTAVTRAKKVVVLVCNRKHLASMVRNNYSSLRLTLLAKFLEEENVKYQRLFASG